MTGRFVVFAGVLLFTAGVVGGLSGCRGKAEANSPAGGFVPTVDVASVQQRDVPLTSEWIASLDGYVNAQIQPHVSGYLIRQEYKEGSVVHKNDVLFEIDPRPFQAALDQSKGQLAQAEAQINQAQAQLAKATQDVARDTPLAEAKAIAQSELDDDLQAKAGASAAVTAAQAATTAAKAAVEQAQLNLSFTKITSLIDGVAGIAQAQIGDLVSTSTVLTSVSQVQPIKVYFSMSEQDYLHAQEGPHGKVRGDVLPLAGVPLTLVLADGSVYPHTGKVLWTDRQIDPSTGTIRVAAAFPNSNNVLRPGQYGRVRAVTQVRQNALVVPQAAVTELQGTYSVAVVGPDNKVAVQQVQVGPQVGPNWIITQGLSANQKVMVGGLQYARPGAMVNPKPVAATAPEGQ
ncbi:MAG TPA: efflux RND transporter periplasmic adaptor subunit [Candidatus Acidoferrales bacterium]|nr:efflux RND transporter periplasmic adaptor subunit [Candidatus Acidoferrales bacterium]